MDAVNLVVTRVTACTSYAVWDKVFHRIQGRVFVAVWNRVADRVASPIWEKAP